MWSAKPAGQCVRAHQQRWTIRRRGVPPRHQLRWRQDPRADRPLSRCPRPGRGADPGEFVDPALLPRGRVRGAAFTGENSDPVNGPRMGTDGPLAHTPWGKIAYDLAGPQGFARVRASDQAGIAPGAETIAELFGADPTLILLDGLHVRSVQHAFAAPSIRWLHHRAIKAGLLATAHRHVGKQKFPGLIRSMPSWSSLTSRPHRPQPADADQGQADPC